MTVGRTLLGGCVVLVAMALTPAALANDIIGDIFSITVCHDGVCVGFLNVPAEGTWDGQAYVWTLASDHSFLNPQGETMAVLEQGTHIEILPPTAGRSTPQVTLGFAVTAGSATTSFDIRSALLSFATLYNPTGKATVGMNVSDRAPFGGATLTGTGLGLGGAYVAQYNGAVPGGTMFNELITTPVVVAPFGQTPASGDTGWQSIAGAVSDISTQLSFTLTARDSASGTSNFEILPEPASLVLLAGLALLRRR
jgi:hypothetical protein